MSQPYPPQPGFPQAPAPAYPQQAPQQYYQQPQAPQGYPQQFPQQQPAWLPQVPQQAPEEPQYQYATGSLDAFYAQPSSGQGAGLKFPQDGVAYFVIINRALTDSDTEQQTEMNSTKPAFFRDGRPKFVLKVPVNVAPSPEFQDGKAQWFCQGAAKDDLIRAMTAAGAPDGPPEAGAGVYIARVGTRPAGGNFKANVWDIRYWRPADAVALAQQYGIVYPELGAQAAPVAPQVPQAAPVQQAPQQLAPPPAAPQVPQQQVAPPPAPAPAMAAPMAPPAPPAPGAPGGLSLEKQQLLANLTGQPVPAQG